MSANRRTPPTRMPAAAVAVAIVVLVVAASPAAAQPNSFARLRDEMVDLEIVAAGVSDARVIRAMRETPRHEFVPPRQRKSAYYDMALPIGEGQTISPPFVVAYMTEQLDPQPSDRVLEIGTGSGYQAAVLSRLVREVYSIEIVESLGRKAARTLKRVGCKNVQTRIGDGFQGWPDAAPFDKIIVTCSPEKVPQPLVDQLRDGGRMVVPVGERYSQNLYLFTKRDGKLVSEALRATLFVPMTGAAEARRNVRPDPLHPVLLNGSFEEVTGRDPPSVAAWHYQRQIELVEGDPLTPDGSRYVRFTNRDPGRASRALQGFAIDGRSIGQLEIRFRVWGRNIRHGQNKRQWPRIIITYYDERRAVLGSEQVGPFVGTFDWESRQAVLPVPIRAREAILRIGLHGGVGEVAFDALTVRPHPAQG